MKTLILDIETSPSLAYIWSLWDQNISLGALVEVGEVICFAAKWLGEDEVLFYSDFHDGHNVMVQRAWELMDEADAIIHFNGRAFDIKHLNREFFLAELGPPSPHKDIDLLTVCRGRFKFLSNKLQHVAEQIGIGGKEETGGFQTWVRCLQNDPEAWDNMRTYNIGDVVLTEKLYGRLQGWVKGHPSHANFDNNGSGVPVCPNCGSNHLQKRGFYRTQVSEFQQLHCQNCGAWSREATRIDHVKIQPVS